MISLCCKIILNKYSINSLTLQKNGVGLSDFFISYGNNQNYDHFYWKIIGSNQSLSLRINNGLIDNIEVSTNNDLIDRFDSEYSLFDDVEYNIPYLYLIPKHENIKTNIHGKYINNTTNFKLLSYKNAFKICWNEKVNKIMFLTTAIAFEVSEDDELIGIIIFKNLEGTFMEDSLDLTLYP